MRSPLHVAIGKRPRALACAALLLAMAGCQTPQESWEQVAAEATTGTTKVTFTASAVTASAHDGNVPANVIDGQLATRWSANGDGQWIRFDMGTTRTVAFLRVAPYNGTSRVDTFDVQVSAIGSSWTTVAAGLKTALNNNLQLFDISDVETRYVRLLGHGNSMNLWNSFTEIEIHVVSAGDTRFAIPGAAVTASAHDGNLPSNTVDGSLATRWSASGDGQWIRFDLGKPSRVSFVKVAFYNGSSRVSTFDVQTSTDAAAWSTAALGRKSALNNNLQTFDFPDVESARYVRIVGHMNSSNAWNSLTEVEIYGGANTCTDAACGTCKKCDASKTACVPADGQSCGAMAVCQNGSCVGTCTDAGCGTCKKCDASKTACVPADGQSCGAMAVCQNGSCVGTCTDAGCGTCKKCDASKMACVPADGQSCGAMAVCQNGSCVGTCTDAGCGTCKKCDASKTACVPADGQSCGAMAVCQNGSCVGTCTDAGCGTCKKCDASKTACVPADGQSCGAMAVCQNGSCVGTCTDAGCGTCKKCDASKTACVADPTKDGLICGTNAVCKNGVCTS